ncbi:hypothetical protein VTO42DRAFT_3600 [Malbranchea cinnamomea]
MVQPSNFESAISDTVSSFFRFIVSNGWKVIDSTGAPLFGTSALPLWTLIFFFFVVFCLQGKKKNWGQALREFGHTSLCFHILNGYRRRETTVNTIRILTTHHLLRVPQPPPLQTSNCLQERPLHPPLRRKVVATKLALTLTQRTTLAATPPGSPSLQPASVTTISTPCRIVLGRSF